MNPFEKVSSSSGYAQLPSEHGASKQSVEFIAAPVQYLSPSSSSSSSSFFAPSVVYQQPVQQQLFPVAAPFHAFLTSLRHHKQVCMSDFELVFRRDDHPTLWLFSPSPIPGAFLISTMWAPAPASVPLAMQRPVSPAFLRAVHGSNWQLRTGLDPSSDEYLFRIEQHGGTLALRNVASNLFVSAESRCLRADRNIFNHWEEFSLSFPPQENLQIPLPLVDPILTQAVHVRVRFRSQRYNSLLGVRYGTRLCFTSHDNIFEVVPAAPGCVHIVVTSQPHVGWRVVDSRGTVAIGSIEDTRSLFVLERAEDGRGVAVRSAHNGRVCVALCSGLLANRQVKQLWETFSIEIV